MIDIALGAILGLGLLVLVGTKPESPLLRRVAPHLRGVGRADGVAPVERGPVDVLSALIRQFSKSRRRLYSRRFQHRALESQLPGVLDLMSLCVAAGMSPHAAIERVGHSGRGYVPEECRRIALDITLGVSVAQALADSEARVGHPGWSRFIEHVLAARHQGTPLTGILRSLAEDEQQAAGSRLLETASARETFMMFPLVFVILPVTVIIAIYPGLSALGSIAL